MIQKSKLGQNFLNDEAAIARIAAAVGAVAGRTVVEIGPGMGAITESLAARAGRLVAVEYDHQLAIRLKVHFGERVEVIEEDVLKFDFAHAAVEAGQRLAVVGNLPYYITSPILHRLAEAHAAVEVAVLMVQREVADRVVAQPGSRDYGLLSVTTQMYGATERLFTLPPSAFTPPPEVHSTVFRWRLAPRFEELGVEPAPFLRLIQLAFAQKRKTLANNLRAAGIEPTVAAEALAKAELEPLARAESLSLIDFASLCRALVQANALLAPAQE
jgi:16S rRNA (adenine1518-N6/adenine1519-N6)-dimethyltransferase